ncbi:putative FK506-binding protein 2B [Paratrimastix pyriformis]|uniref:peptidylprolyl isomerase n=1 Tax=Paratrimastix pyriformis TaxID=342808 RepID=A0ABQ8UN35_9EUKA|nr:putative FK506-binding protein 2B [Paratrimastix pyriformis]
MLPKRALLVLVAVFAVGALCEDVKVVRPPPKKLQIGVTRRVPAEECTKKSQAGDTLKMHYKGYLYDTGAVFDSSYDRKDPFTFKLGAGQVIKGWDQGLLNMCIGEKRKLVIPSSLGYGDRGAGSKIPGGATLVFEAELLDISRGSEDL